MAASWTEEQLRARVQFPTDINMATITCHTHPHILHKYESFASTSPVRLRDVREDRVKINKIFTQYVSSFNFWCVIEGRHFNRAYIQLWTTWRGLGGRNGRSFYENAPLYFTDPTDAMQNNSVAPGRE